MSARMPQEELEARLRPVEAPLIAEAIAAGRVRRYAAGGTPATELAGQRPAGESAPEPPRGRWGTRPDGGESRARSVETRDRVERWLREGQAR